jgi:hypothetical protein
MQKTLLLLVGFLMVILLITAIGKPHGETDTAGPALLFYYLVLLMSILSLMTGIYRMIKGKRTLLSFLHIFFSLIVFALSFYLVINQR